MQHGHADSAAHKCENDGDRGRGRKTEFVEKIQKRHFGDHHRKKDDHQIFKGIHFRVVNTGSGNGHHAARKGCPKKNAKAGDDHHRFETRDART